MAYLYVNADGVTRPYSTITDAITVASGGDTIVIDPGVYVERVDIDKELNIRGNTETPENDDIIIDPYPTYNFPSIIITHVLTDYETIHIEGVTLRSVTQGAHFESVFVLTAAQSANQYLNLIFNRCRFIMSGSSGSGFHQTTLNLGGTWTNQLWFDHCEWELDTVGTAYEYEAAGWDYCNDERILACVYEGAYQCYSCIGFPAVNNYVTEPTEGYGPAYSSDWYVELDYPVVGYFDGYVTEEGSPVQRTLYLYKRDNGEYLGTTESNPSGYYYIETTYSGLHHIVAIDDPADPLYNDLIIGSAEPTSL